MGLQRDLLDDETSPMDRKVNLALALESYPAWAERLQDPQLKASFITECVRSVPYYSALTGDRRDVRSFPIVGKQFHLASRDAFTNTNFTDERLRRLSTHTNGTLGPSLRVFLDLPSFFDSEHASYLRFVSVLPEVRWLLAAGEPSVFVVSDSPRDLRSSVIMPTLNGTLLRRLVISRNPPSDAAAVECLRRSQIAFVHGKPSVLLRLADLDAEHPGDQHIAPAGVVCSGENLYPDDRARLSSWYGCPVLNAYATSEAGLVAFECQQRNVLHVLSDHLTVEVLQRSGSLNGTGTGELVMTNALNWRQVFIRYRVGDVAHIILERCPCGHEGQSIDSLPGRERLAYDQSGARTSSADIAAAIGSVKPAVKQFQIAQEPDSRIVVSWISAKHTDHRRTAVALQAQLRDCFPRLRFELRRVASINAPGGKLRRFL